MSEMIRKFAGLVVGIVLAVGIGLVGPIASAPEAAAAPAVPSAVYTSVSTLPGVAVSGGTKAQRARVAKLAKQAGAPRGTRIVIVRSWGHWATTYPMARWYLMQDRNGAYKWRPDSTIYIRQSVVAAGGAKLGYVVFHETAHARQAQVYGSSMFSRSHAYLDCQADRMAKSMGAKMVRGSYLSRGFGRFCSTARAKQILKWSR